MVFDVLIIGSGPAGLTAAIYASRAGLNTAIVCGTQPGGQLTITTDVENYPGFADPIQGPYLMEQMQLQAERYGTKIIQDTITNVNLLLDTKVASSARYNYLAKTVIIATGASAKWLGLESETLFRGYGVSSCATCDGPLFKNQIVAVVGGGNVATEEALYLSKHASKVYLIHRGTKLKAEQIIQDRVFVNPKISTIFEHKVQKIVGTLTPIKSVNGVVIENINSKETQTMTLDGIFISIGHSPNTLLFQGQINTDEHGYIKINNFASTHTNVDGVFAAGDVHDRVYRQAITAAGSGCMAALDAQRYLNSL